MRSLGFYGSRRSDWKTHVPRRVVFKLYVAIREACSPRDPILGALETADRSSGMCEAGVKRGCSTKLIRCYGDVASSDDDNPYGLGPPFWRELYRCGTLFDGGEIYFEVDFDW